MLMTQEELAERVYVNRETISNWEREATRPCRKYIKWLTQALDTTEEGLGLEGGRNHQ